MDACAERIRRGWRTPACSDAGLYKRRKFCPQREAHASNGWPRRPPRACARHGSAAQWIHSGPEDGLGFRLLFVNVSFEPIVRSGEFPARVAILSTQVHGIVHAHPREGACRAWLPYLTEETAFRRARRWAGFATTRSKARCSSHEGREYNSSDEVRSRGLRLLTFPDFTQPNSREKLMKRIAAVIIVGLICSTLSIATSAQQSVEQAGAATPRWVLHVANYPGGISNGVRGVLAAQGEIGGSGAAS